MVVISEPVIDPAGQWLEVIAQRFCGGDPLTPQQAYCLRVVSGLVPRQSSSQWERYVAGDTGPDDIWPLAEVPEWVLFMVSHGWLRRFLDAVAGIGHRIDEGLVPYPNTMAERVALWIALRQARKVGPMLNTTIAFATLNDLAAPGRHGIAERDWNRARLKLFGGDFEFLKIWRNDVNLSAIDSGASALDIGRGGPTLRRFHPRYWWDTEIGC